MVADYELVESRTISGKGVLKFPNDKKTNRSYILYASVIRPPKSQYVNLNYNPNRSRYGFITFLRNDYVVDTASMEFDKQSYDGVNDIAGQVLIALKCANNAILQSIFNLSVALAATPGGTGLQPVNFENVIKDYTNLRLAWDECRFVCYADTAVSLRLYALKYDTCNADFDKDKPPAPPPPPPPKVPPGTPVPNSDPYDPATQDNGNSSPYPGDNPVPPEPPTQGTPCAQYDVMFSFTQSFNGTTPGTNTRTVRVFGKIGDLSFAYTGGTTKFYLMCQGLAPGTCLPYQKVTLGDNAFSNPPIEVLSVALISVTPV